MGKVHANKTVGPELIATEANWRNNSEMRKPSPTMIRIVQTILPLHPEPFTGYQVLLLSGVKSGSVYPTLHRLVGIGWITREVQASTVGQRRPISRYRWADPGFRYYAARVVYDSTNGIVRGRGDRW